MKEKVTVQPVISSAARNPAVTGSLVVKSTPRDDRVPERLQEKIGVVILTSRGPRHSWFCRELADHFDLRGIVVDARYGFWHRLEMLLKSHGLNPFSIAKTLTLKKKMRPFEERDKKMENKFFPRAVGGSEFPEGVPVLMSRDPNDEKTQKWVRALNPDVIAVFGTRIIQEPLLSLARSGALNIHTGLSPYYRGGQCTFWCLYENDLGHVGVTIHHLTQKIDGGDIVYTAQPVVEPADTVRSLECKLVKLGTEKMIQAISGIHAGTAPRTQQDLKGKLFLSKMYTLEKRLELEERLKKGRLNQSFPHGSAKQPPCGVRRESTGLTIPDKRIRG